MSNPTTTRPWWQEDEEQAPRPLKVERVIRDPVGMWHMARAGHGVDDRVWLGLFEGRSQDPRWFTCSQRCCDPPGALSLLLAERGYGPVGAPAGAGAAMPGWRQLWQGWRGSPAAPPPGMRWRCHDPSLAACMPHAPVSVLLTTEQTRTVAATAAATGVAVAVWLHWTADRALRAILADADSMAGWRVPVNLRGRVTVADAHANQCSDLELRMGGATTAQELERQQGDRLARHEHWRRWLWLGCGRWLGQGGVNSLYRLGRAMPGGRTGVCADLGEWNIPGLSGIGVTTAGCPVYPVVLGTVLCNGRRSLSCRLHPVIGGDARRAIELLTQWRARSLAPAPVAAPGMSGPPVEGDRQGGG